MAGESNVYWDWEGGDGWNVLSDGRCSLHIGRCGFENIHVGSKRKFGGC